MKIITRSDYFSGDIFTGFYDQITTCGKCQSILSSAGLLRNDDSLSISVARKLKTIKPVIKINGFAIDPVAADLKLSIPKINAIPEI